MSKRVLVTGGAGFLGSHLCAVLLDQGCEVLCIDNFFTGSRANVDTLLDNRKFEIVRHDVTLPLYVEVTRSTISPAPPHPSTISTTPCTRPKPASWAPSTCSASPSG
jgi:UDP-glucuronate decarboxylase